MIVLAADFLASAQTRASWPAEGAPEIAFCGRSNVGKSSCLNALAGRQGLARVSRTPGRTRLINFFEVTLGEKTRTGARGREQKLRLVDLPGYGYASGPKKEKAGWGEMIEQYLTGRSALRALVVLVDGEIGPQPSDREMCEFAGKLPRELLVVATKIDKLSRNRREQALQKAASFLGLPREALLGFSAKERIGVEELWQVVAGIARGEA